MPVRAAPSRSGVTPRSSRYSRRPASGWPSWPASATTPVTRGAAISTCGSGRSPSAARAARTHRQDRPPGSPQPRPVPAGPRPARPGLAASAVARDRQPGAADRRRQLPDDHPPRPRASMRAGRLTRTAVLERMCGPLCEAVLEMAGSAAMLADLAGSNLLLVPLDRRGEWYRYHHLFRDMLLAELHRLEPGLMPVLRRRAAGWYLRNGWPEEALEYSMAAGDVDGAARLVGQLAVPAYRQGRVTTIQRWFGWLEDRGGIKGHPMTAVLASFFSALMGRPVDAERWADAVDRWQYGDPARPDDPATEAWAIMVRAVLCRRGAERMRADTDEAVRRFAAGSFLTPTPALMQGIARILCGDLDGGDLSLEDAVSVGEQVGSTNDVVIGLCERSLVAMARSQWDRAEALADQARTVLRQAGIEESYATPLICALRARAAMHRADVPAARRELVTAQHLRPMLTYALPHFAVQARIELARVHLALADLPGARTLMREVDDLLRRRPGLGTLIGEARALRAQLSRERGSSVPGASALTAAELRLMPLLSTHLSFPEIAEQMFLSRYTVKSQAMSIYHKLGASSRNQAVARSRELGLLEG